MEECYRVWYELRRRYPSANMRWATEEEREAIYAAKMAGNSVLDNEKN